MLNCRNSVAKLRVTVPQAAPASHRTKKLRFNEFVLDLAAGKLHRNGSEVRLQAQPYQILVYLAQRVGEVVTRDELRRQLWSSDTFVDFDNGLNAAINKVREALGDSTENPQFIETLPRRGYRFIAAVEQAENGGPATVPERTAVSTDRKLTVAWIIGVLLIAAALGAVYLARRPPVRQLTDKDTIVLADFDNGTKDTVFDDTLKRALAVQLQQSPFLSLVSDEQMRQTLHFMGRTGNPRVVGELAREVCQREGATAVLQGTIRSLGSHYFLDVSAISCRTGASVAEEQTEVAGKEQILAALGIIAARLRGKLGESLSLIQAYDTPVLQATTPSLDALKAYSLGANELNRLNAAGALAFFKRAIELDPKFALAYVGQADAYGAAGEDELSRASLETAYSLRDGVSEQERLYITALYHDIVSGDFEQILAANWLWVKMYPRDTVPLNSLAFHYNVIGSFDKALDEATLVLRNAPDSGFGRLQLATAEFGLQNWRGARAALEPILARGQGDYATYCFLFVAAFAEGDQAAMQSYVEAARKNLQEGEFARLQFIQAEIAASAGNFKLARELDATAEQMALEVGLRQNAGAMAGQQALWESQAGDLLAAREHAKLALAQSTGIDVSVNAAVALAAAGDARDAQAIADSLARNHPHDTLVNAVSVPLIRSAIELAQNQPRRAIAAVNISRPYELGFGFLYYPAFMPTYIRGQAYLKLHDGPKAASEFKTMLNHRGLDPASPLYALAQLGLARAEAMTDDKAGALSAYEQFLARWKDANPDLPVYRLAHSEYAALRGAS